jgi:hypothetical protein
MAVAASDSRPRGLKDRATQTSLLSDELVRRLIGVGQVDIVVGVPTLNHADTIAATLGVIDEGLARYFPRARTVVIGADGGSSDGTVEIAANGTAGAALRSAGLRTRHRIAASYRGVPGRASAIRLTFTAADLLQAQAVAICDADATGLAPEWIGALIAPIKSQSLDVVAGTYRRHPLERVLVTQLVRPLIRGAFGRQFDHPVLGVFACSRRFAARCLAEDVWDRSPVREGIDVWLAGSAVAGDYQLGQVSLGRFAAPRRPGASLQEVFAPLVGALFETLCSHASAWIPDGGAVLPPVIALDQSSPAELEPPEFDSSGLGASFFQDVRDLRPVLEQILATNTLASLLAIAAEGMEVVRYDDETWVTTVYDFVLAHHRGVMDRTHIAQALMPLYLGRVASFIGEHAESSITDIEQALERLSQQFESQRQYLIKGWHRTT